VRTAERRPRTARQLHVRQEARVARAAHAAGSRGHRTHSPAFTRDALPGQLLRAAPPGGFGVVRPRE
jgi:hypothetical protein